MKYVFLIFLFTAVVTFAQTTDSNTGRKAPNFQLQSIEGKTVELKSQTGQGPLLLSFWATWCKPCKEELPELQKIYAEYKDKGLKMYAISIDAEKSVGQVKPYVKAQGYTFPVLLDTNSDVARLYYATAVPFTVLINRSGKIEYSHLGYKKGDEIIVKQKIEAAL